MSIPSHMKLFKNSICRNDIHLCLLRSGPIHGFKTVSLIFLVTFDAILDGIFWGNPFVRYIWKQPASKSNSYILNASDISMGNGCWSVQAYCRCFFSHPRLRNQKRKLFAPKESLWNWSSWDVPVCGFS